MITRLKVKQELVDMNSESEVIDLEAALQYTVSAFADVSAKWDARLEALFVTADADQSGTLDFEEFESVSECVCVRIMWLIECVCVHTFKHTCIHAYTYTFSTTYTYTYTHIHIHIRTCVHT